MTASCPIDALVPVKPLEHGKGRLGGVLSASHRRELVLAMLEDVLGALAASGVVRSRYVSSSDPEVLALALECGAVALAEPSGVRGLNDALEWARTRILVDSAPCALLVVPADLPGLSAQDVAEFLAEPPARPSIRICPSQDRGTNALLQHPPNAITFAFGVLSSEAHISLATQNGLAVEQREPPGLRFDIDSPEDLRTRLEDVRGPATLRLLAALD